MGRDPSFCPRHIEHEINFTPRDDRPPSLSTRSHLWRTEFVPGPFFTYLNLSPRQSTDEIFVLATRTLLISSVGGSQPLKRPETRMFLPRIIAFSTCSCRCFKIYLLSPIVLSIKVFVIMRSTSHRTVLCTSNRYM